MKQIRVTGTARSDFPSGSLPDGSCMVIALRDVSIMDVASFELNSIVKKVYFVQDLRIDEQIKFEGDFTDIYDLFKGSLLVWGR